MKREIIVAAFLASIITTALAQEPVITSFQNNGQVAWTNAVNPNALYRMEWASSLNGTGTAWHSFTYSSTP